MPENETKRVDYYCVYGDCQNEALPGYWLCKDCGDRYGNCPLDGIPIVPYRA